MLLAIVAAYIATSAPALLNGVSSGGSVANACPPQPGDRSRPSNSDLEGPPLLEQRL